VADFADGEIRVEALPVRRILTTDSVSPQAAGTLSIETHTLAPLLGDCLQRLSLR
jgi:hypothetical protein